LSASDAGGSVTGMKFSNDGTTYSSEVLYASSYSWTLTSGYGTKTVYVLFKDASGKWMTTPVTDTIELASLPDTTPPTGSVTINSGRRARHLPTVTLTLSASDAAGANRHEVHATTGRRIPAKWPTQPAILNLPAVSAPRRFMSSLRIIPVTDDNPGYRHDPGGRQCRTHRECNHQLRCGEHDIYHRDTYP
jgi:hypothetical protein